MRGCLWLTAGLLVAALAGFVAFTALNRATRVESGAPGAAPPVEVVAAAQAIPVRAALTAEDVILKKVPVDAAPEGALRAVEDAVGKITLVDLYQGEVILSQRLVDPNVAAASGRLALVVAADEVLMAFPAGDLMSQSNVLKPGDRVDFLFSLDFPVNRGVAGATGPGGGQQDEEQQTFDVLQNVMIAAVVGQETTEAGAEAGEPQALLFTVSPQDALVLKYMLDAGGRVDIVLRAPGQEGPFTVEPVDVDYMIDRYQIPTLVGR
jgi:pilus assembly protein CpaB